MSSLRLEVDRIDSEVGGALVRALLQDLRDRYGAEDPDRPDPSDLAAPGGVFLVAWFDDEPVGCGGVRAHGSMVALARGPDVLPRTWGRSPLGNDIGEIKRMYVKPTARRAGVARAVLAELETRARMLGYTRLRLETGIRQPEAIALYESFGYTPIEPYGLYRDEPMSRCLERHLG